MTSQTYTPTQAEKDELELFTLAYGDTQTPARGCRLLDFKTEGHGGNFEHVAALLRLIGGYNAFDPETVIEALRSVYPKLASVSVGREGSPVIYVEFPYWTHQQIGGPEWGSGEQRPLDDDEVKAIALEFMRAMRSAHADEISVEMTGENYWYEGRGYPAKAPQRPHRCRSWWD